MIFENSKVVFIHYPKTGGNSVQDALRQYAEDTIAIKNHWQDGVERFEVTNPKYPSLNKHSTLLNYKKEFGDKFYDYQFFLTIRNPFDRLVSSYFSPSRFFKKPHLDIAKFSIQKFKEHAKHMRTLEDFLNVEDWQSTTNVCFLKFEELEDDFGKLCKAIGITNISLPNRNASERLDYRECYDETLKRWVYLKHELEISIGNYEF